MGGKALITFFILDQSYYRTAAAKTEEKSKYHNTKQSDWVFDQPAYGSQEWFYPAWAKVPEYAIGITPKGLELMLKDTGLKIEKIYSGNWKEMPGLYFQDILVLKKEN